MTGVKTPVDNASVSKDDELRSMLKDLGRSLSRAISSSDNVHEAVQRFRDEGYRLHLVLDCQHEDEDRKAQIQLSAARPSPSPEEPTFRVDGDDVAFLRSIGIDATRPGRRRR